MKTRIRSWKDPDEIVEENMESDEWRAELVNSDEMSPWEAAWCEGYFGEDM